MGHKHSRSAARAQVLLGAATVCAVVAVGGVWGTAEAAPRSAAARPRTRSRGRHRPSLRACRYAAPPSRTPKPRRSGRSPSRPRPPVASAAPLPGRRSGRGPGPTPPRAGCARAFRAPGGDGALARLRRHPARRHGPAGAGRLVRHPGGGSERRTGDHRGGLPHRRRLDGLRRRAAGRPENVHVAVVDPRTFRGTVEGTHDGNVARRVTTSSVAAGLGSLVGVNAGFFVTSDADGVQGTQAGVSADHGELQSMASGSRAALILKDGGRHVRVADLTTTVTVRAGGSAHQAQGINRVPGLIRDCGRPGATPSELPWQDVTCHTADDLVLFTGEFGAPLPTGRGTQVVLDAHGRVVSAGSRGGAVRPTARCSRASVRQRTGSPLTPVPESGSAWTRSSVTRRASASCSTATTASSALPPRSSVTAASASTRRRGCGRPSGPVLRVRLGERPSAAHDGRCGRQGPADPGHGGRPSERWQRRLHPAGGCLLHALDRRRRRHNLDGGGSTAMAVNGSLVNRPSDATGERAVGGTIQILPGRTH